MDYIEFDLSIEHVKVLEFAEAIGERHPLVVDLPSARGAGLDNLLAPPTFTATEQWQVGLDRLASLGAGLDIDHMLHAGQEYSYHRLPVAGEVLHGLATIGPTWEKRGGRGGALKFKSFVMTYSDDNRSPVLASTYTLVEMESSSEDASRGGPGHRALRQHPTWGPEVVAEPLTRVHFARYAGASGDFNPMHVDEGYARSVGLPSVFAMGMLPAGMLTSAAVRWFGDPRRLRAIKFRFVSRAWPGDTLVAVGWDDPPNMSLELWRGTKGAHLGDLVEPVVRCEALLGPVD